MGIVIPFTEFKRAQLLAASNRLHPAGPDLTSVDAAVRAAGNQSALLRAAKPILDVCRDRYGFIVMRDGLPEEPKLLGRSIFELYKALSLLDMAMGAPRTYPSYGVYFSRPKLAWFEDGYSGDSGLAVPNGTNATDISSFIASRVLRQRAHLND